MRSLEECAVVVLRKWPQNDPCERCGGTGITEVGTSGGWGEIPCPAHRNPIPITPAELLADDDGRPSKWLDTIFWAQDGAWLKRSLTGRNYYLGGFAYGSFRAESPTRKETVTRALCALAEAS